MKPRQRIHCPPHLPAISHECTDIMLHCSYLLMQPQLWSTCLFLTRLCLKTEYNIWENASPKCLLRSDISFLMFCRMLNSTFQAGRTILAIDFMVFTLRLIHIFAIHKQLGPKIIIVERMVSAQSLSGKYSCFLKNWEYKIFSLQRKSVYSLSLLLYF